MPSTEKCSKQTTSSSVTVISPNLLCNESSLAALTQLHKGFDTKNMLYEYELEMPSLNVKYILYELGDIKFKRVVYDVMNKRY